MTFSNYLKGQLNDFVDSYKKYFWRTFGTALTYTVLSFVGMSVLLKFSIFDETSRNKQISLLSYLFSQYSYKDTYSLVDLSKSVILFFVSLFSIGLLRLTKNDIDNGKELSFGSFIRELRGLDIISLLGILILCSVADFAMFRLEAIAKVAIENYQFEKWVYTFLFLLRIYVPLILFSLTLYKLTSNNQLKLNFKKIIFLFVSLWFFNEFAYEFSLIARGHIFSLLLSPFDESKTFIYESILGVSLVGFFFIGYHSAMTTSLKLLDEQ